MPLPAKGPVRRPFDSAVGMQDILLRSDEHAVAERALRTAPRGTPGTAWRARDSLPVCRVARGAAGNGMGRSTIKWWFPVDGPRATARSRVMRRSEMGFFSFRRDLTFICIAVAAVASSALAAEPPPPNAADTFGLVEASGLHWRHLSSRNGDLPVPGISQQQTGAVVGDLAGDGVNGFVLSFRQKAPALVWYRRTKTAWDRYVIDDSFLTVEAGGVIYDIDGDGKPDVLFGADWQGADVWWWKNPGPPYDPGKSWKRYTVKHGGGTQHHDQVIADFKGIGKPQLVYWNQGAKKLFIADVPAKPAEATEWPATEVFSGAAGENPGKYAEGVAAADIDGDGKQDLLAGNYWFKYIGENRFKPVRIGTIGGRVAAAPLV